MTIPAADLKAVFSKALDVSIAERASFLAEACAGNPDLRAQVEGMLRALEQAGSFLESPADANRTTVAEKIGERPGSMIGPYKLLEQIGEGGFGVVFMAEQQEPIRRKVALKILKPGMDTRQVIARFEAERQVLALMDHPNIAKVLEGGATATGRPYFVMELVKGIPITDYCDQNQLSLRERLGLFIHVCQAVQHAHQKGIIHRDVKPSNVLVTLRDGEPVPKVIDFGIAKALGQQLTDKTLFTGFAQMIGTPLYMSPEQAGLSEHDVDTRSDVYSLGVLLYELLTGATPFDKERLKDASYDEVRRIIREEEPPKPSTRISTLGQAASTVSANRRSDPKRLGQLCRGELDWIVMKCLEKDRNRRYETANGLAMDVLRYLHDEPVQACPPSAAYRIKKFVRRNRRAVIAASLVALALVGGIIGTTWQAVRAERARQRESERAEGERLAKLEAQERGTETRAVLDFVENRVLAAARPVGRDGGLGHAVPLRRAVEAALPFVAHSFKDQPLIEARLRMTLGLSFAHLGEDRIAIDQYQIARALFTKHLGPDHPNTLSCISNLATSYGALGRHMDAFKLREEALERKKVVLGPDHPITLNGMHNLAASYLALGQLQDAFRLGEETLALQRTILGAAHPDTLSSAHNLASTYSARGRHVDAVKLREETLALMESKLGSEHPQTLQGMTNLASSYNDLGRHAEALKLREKAFALQKSTLGPTHPDTLMTMLNLPASYFHLGRFPEAINLYKETLEALRVKLDLDHPHTLVCAMGLANGYAAAGRPGEALKLYEETLSQLKVKLGLDHPHTLMTMNNLALSYDLLGRQADALKLREETLALHKAKYGPRHTETLRCMTNLANSFDAHGRHTDALNLREETLVLLRAELGPEHHETLLGMNNLANSYYFLDQHDRAFKLHEETLALRTSTLGPNHPDTLQSVLNLANGHLRLGRPTDALKLQEATLAAYRDNLGADSPEALHCKHNLAISYDALGRDKDALKLFEEVLEVRKKLHPDHPDTLVSLYSVAEMLVKQDRGAEALPMIDECVRRAAGKVVDPRLIPLVMGLRMKYYQKQQDVAGCRTTAEMWEKMNRGGAVFLFDAAWCRAVTAAVIRNTDKSPTAVKDVEAEIDRAMAWLRKAVAAGYNDAGRLATDKDFDVLRDREDFKNLLADLEKRRKNSKDRNE